MVNNAHVGSRQSFRLEDLAYCDVRTLNNHTREGNSKCKRTQEICIEGVT